jgi:hypothetical protein
MKYFSGIHLLLLSFCLVGDCSAFLWLKKVEKAFDIAKEEVGKEVKLAKTKIENTATIVGKEVEKAFDIAKEEVGKEVKLSKTKIENTATIVGKEVEKAFDIVKEKVGVVTDKVVDVFKAVKQEIEGYLQSIGKFLLDVLIIGGFVGVIFLYMTCPCISMPANFIVKALFTSVCAGCGFCFKKLRTLKLPSKIQGSPDLDVQPELPMVPL